MGLSPKIAEYIFLYLFTLYFYRDCRTPVSIGFFEKKKMKKRIYEVVKLVNDV